MTTDRNAQGVDGLAEVMGLLGMATPGEWTRTFGSDTGPNDDYYIEWEAAGPAQVYGANADADADAIAAAVNYLRSHGEAIRELVEADREYDAAMRSEADTDGMLRREAARARRRAALAKLTEPRP